MSTTPITDTPTHRHKKRGSEYVLIGIGKMQTEGWSEYQPKYGEYWRVDMREVAIYRSAIDPTEIWVRPREEFEDGRFEVLPGAALSRPVQAEPVERGEAVDWRATCAEVAKAERHNREGSESAFERGAVAASYNIETAILALAHPAPVSPAGTDEKRIAERLPDAFITSTSANPDYFVTVKTKTLKDAHRWHDAVLALSRSPAPDRMETVEAAFREGWEKGAEDGQRVASSTPGGHPRDPANLDAEWGRSDARAALNKEEGN